MQIKYIVINIEYCYVITDKLYDLNQFMQL